MAHSSHHSRSHRSDLSLSCLREREKHPIDTSCLDFESTAPLFTSTSYSVVEDDICWACSSNNSYYDDLCWCPDEQRMEYYRMLVSIPSNPVITIPGESVYCIKVQKGTARSSEHLAECLSGTTEDLVCDFSISSTLDDSDDPIRDLVRRHVSHTYPSHVFPRFR